METFLPKWLDALLRKHPAIMLLCVVALAAAACVIVVAGGHNRLVYEGF